MGSGIATALLLSNIRVVLKEVNTEYLMKGIKSVEGYNLIQNISSYYLIEQTFELLSMLSLPIIILDEKMNSWIIKMFFRWNVIYGTWKVYRHSSELFWAKRSIHTIWWNKRYYVWLLFFYNRCNNFLFFIFLWQQISKAWYLGENWHKIKQARPSLWSREYSITQNSKMWTWSLRSASILSFICVAVICLSLWFEVYLNLDSSKRGSALLTVRPCSWFTFSGSDWKHSVETKHIQRNRKGLSTPLHFGEQYIYYRPRLNWGKDKLKRSHCWCTFLQVSLYFQCPEDFYAFSYFIKLFTFVFLL